jgi:D-alanyl-D-alanine carboxypeptidase (penicillin-binding protein 5/6)
MIRWLPLVCLVLSIVVLGPSTPGSVPGAPRPAAAAEPDLPHPPPVADGDYRAFPRVFPLKTLEQPTAFHEAGNRPRNAPAILASSAILVDLDRGTVMWSIDPHARRAPASTAKLVSALVALENFTPDQAITISPEAADSDPVETRMELLNGERLSARELLSGMLTISANDAARAFAYGSVGMDDYVAGMNRQVRALGLRDSHFTNPVGFPDDPDMYSSAYDLAVVAGVEFRAFPLFGQLTSSQEVDLAETPTHRAYKLHNINRLLGIYPAAIGTKSGYTDEAGPCLVSMAQRDGHRLLAVLLNAPHMFDQSRALLEWGFGQEGLAPLPPAPASIPSVPAIRH